MQAQRNSRDRTRAEANTDEIRCRAYALYEERGRQDGYDMQDWLRAEAEINGGPREPQPASSTKALPKSVRM